MGASKRLLEEQQVCGECGADLEWDNGQLVCSADCPNVQMDRYDRLANNRDLRAQGWDAFHEGSSLTEPPFAGPAAEAWERGWKLAEKGKRRP